MPGVLTDDSPDAPTTESSEPVTHRARGLAVALDAIAAVWTVLYARRRAAHQANVDDFLYALTSQAIYNGFHSGPTNGVHEFLTTGFVSPLVPLLAAPLTHLDGVEGAVAVNLPLLLLLAAGAYMLARRWVDRTPASLIAGVVALNPAVLGWSHMFHFAIASTAFVLWALAGYVHSDGLRKWNWSLTMGAAIGFLLLTRTMAPAYVAPLVVVIAVQQLLGPRRQQWRAWLPKLAGATGLTLLIAGPWWARSGSDALDYLWGVGIDKDSSSVSSSTDLASQIANRVPWTLSDLGAVSGTLLVVLAVVAIVVLVLRRRLGADAVAVVAWAVGTYAVLATTGQGTGFELPLLAVLIVGVGAALTHLPAAGQKAVVAVTAVVLVSGIAGMLTDGQGSLLPAPVYRTMTTDVGADRNTNFDDVYRRVIHEIGTGKVVVVHHDNMFNNNGLKWNNPRGVVNVKIPECGRDGAADAIAKLDDAEFLITGTTKAACLVDFDQEAVESAAQQKGYTQVAELELGPENTVRIWRR